MTKTFFLSLSKILIKTDNIQIKLTKNINKNNKSISMILKLHINLASIKLLPGCVNFYSVLPFF